MLNLPQQVKGITHPLVSDIYLKKEFGYGHHSENVLVIEARSNDDEEMEFNTFDSYLIDLLTDLEDLKEQAEEKIGKFDRVDIRSK